MITVYAVCCSEGEYDDRESWVEGVFEREKDAAAVALGYAHTDVYAEVWPWQLHSSVADWQLAHFLEYGEPVELMPSAQDLLVALPSLPHVPDSVCGRAADDARNNRLEWAVEAAGGERK